MLGLRLPDHRRAAAVAALVFRPEGDAGGIDQFLEGELRFGLAQFLALIEADRAFEREKKRRRLTRERIEIFGMLDPAADVTNDVVI